MTDGVADARTASSLSEPGTRALPSGAAPLAGNALAARTLSLPRRLRMRVGDTCQAH